MWSPITTYVLNNRFSDPSPIQIIYMFSNDSVKFYNYNFSIFRRLGSPKEYDKNIFLK